MGNPEELLETARRLWYSDKDALGAQQILDGIVRDHPDSPEAEEAAELRNLIAALQPLGESGSDRPKGWRHTVRENAFSIVFFLIMMFVALLWRLDPLWVRTAMWVVLGLVFGLLAFLFKPEKRNPSEERPDSIRGKTRQWLQSLQFRRKRR